MRKLFFVSALLIAAASAASNAAGAATRYTGKSMTVKFANGRAMRFRLMRINGRMMMVAPYGQMRDVFHGTAR